ncbi:hypothetical protein EHW99_3537 [Erwinia amylovora]|uniref:Uncharacterized protein n=2 Tax=Erwinia amylovora TaxID=552 RepID=A0A831A2S7_ERWAM|nr:hypothetical protein EaACW_3614 [Erwinia amylovora ACW56400]QJQ56236.1 hypothetical protein EHX00_3537 [Erwinia amylovora]CBA23952.1 hypothetical protein predicted by Glimmer/Critica [Erwinia amylovora CFBP1430]CCO80449.1 hypothetical protein BN432_3682 [Erwinia amylovora Ea356]CCO84256.1 hypothetical protein BN433_3712 [Erwinia amylovora Ea266]CCO88014.1 hypothetical protein BN434_3656 [Erwinia amylovora CFBP 2585]CCO91806.1 hypothetical protein BN435_3666 [Erwinia amylovora 01SFR-BO]CCO
MVKHFLQPERKRVEDLNSVQNSAFRAKKPG